MLLKRLKSNSAVNLFFILVAALAFWMNSLLHPFNYDFSSCENNTVLFAPIYRLIGSHPLVNVGVSLLLVVALAFLMQLINDRYSFIRIRSKLPSILFVIIVGGFFEMHTLHPVYFAAIFVLFSINRLFGIYEKAKPYSAILDVGFLLGIASLFCFNLIALFPAFLISVVLLGRETKLREIIILLLGFLLPFVFAFSYAVLTENLEEILDLFTQSFIIPVNHFKGNYALQMYLGILVLYTFVGSIDILKQYDKKKNSSRKYFTAFFWIFIFSMISFIFMPSASLEMLVITSIPVTFLISNFFVFKKNRFWGELLFTLLLAIVIFMQFAERFSDGT